MKIILLIFLFTTGLFAELDWSGYFESEGDVIDLPNANYTLFYNKFRLGTEANPNEHIRIFTNMVYKSYSGSSSILFDDFLHPDYIPAFVAGQMNYEFKDTLFIDNVFLQFRHTYFDLTLGKQQISPGVGYAWNPTDIFNIKDVMDPTYEQTGVSAMSLDIPIYNFMINGIIQPEEDWKNSPKYIRLSSYISGIDISMVAAQVAYEIQGLLSYEKYDRTLLGLNIEGELFGIGYRSELAFNFLENNAVNPSLTEDYYGEYVFGLDYTFKNSLYVLSEYFHNDFGVEKSMTTLDNYLMTFAGQTHSLNQNYLFTYLMYPLTDLVTGGLLSIANLDDTSLSINPQLTYNIYEDVILDFMANIFIGDEKTEFGYQKYGMRVRLNAYF